MFDERARRTLVPYDDWWHESHAIALPRQETQHCHIVYLCEYSGLYPVANKLTVKGDAYIAFHARQDDRHLPQIVWIAEALISLAWSSDQTYGLLLQETACEGRACVELTVSIRQHHIKGERLELVEELAHGA